MTSVRLLQINRLTKKDCGVKSLSLFFMFLMIVYYYVFYDPVAHDTLFKKKTFYNLQIPLFHGAELGSL